MKTDHEIQAAYEALEAAAKYASSHGHLSSYEVLANSAMAIGWVLGIEGHVTAGFEELLKDADWAARKAERQKMCDHPWHRNPGLMTRCPQCNQQPQP